MQTQTAKQCEVPSLFCFQAVKQAKNDLYTDGYKMICTQIATKMVCKWIAIKMICTQIAIKMICKWIAIKWSVHR
jgi:hypothetical protein